MAEAHTRTFGLCRTRRDGIHQMPRAEHAAVANAAFTSAFQRCATVSPARCITASMVVQAFRGRFARERIPRKEATPAVFLTGLRLQTPT